MPNRIPSLRCRQGGAVAIILGIVIVMLIAFVGLALDIGHLYNRKVELQNAADAAALAGARELNGTADGVAAAAVQAIALAAANRSDFGATPVAITNDEIAFSDSPDGPWVSVADAIGAPENLFFIEVDTTGIAQGTRPTWFMRAVSAAFNDATTFGRAVAGRTFCEGLPIFTCPRPGGTAPNYGFVKGTSYRLAYSASGEIGPGNIGWMDPVPPDATKLIIGADEMRDVLCFGKTYCLATGTYTTLTQPAFDPMMDALNTRFNIYQGTLNKATYRAACPSDTNIRNFGYDVVDGDSAVDWLATPAAKQSLDETEAVNATGDPRVVHWAGVRPNSGDTPTVLPANYPSAGSGTAGDFSGTPYGQTSGSYSEAPPPGATTQAGRRLITLGIASGCPVGGGSGNPVEIVTFARFLMQRTAVGTGGPSERGMFLEFIGTVSSPPVVLPEIKLYR